MGGKHRQEIKRRFGWREVDLKMCGGEEGERERRGVRHCII